MTRRLAATIAAGALVVGLVAGAAGAILVGGGSPQQNWYDQMAEMHSTMAGMMGGQWGAGMMGGQWGAGMMRGQYGPGMMGGYGMMGGQWGPGMMGPWASQSPQP